MTIISLAPLCILNLINIIRHTSHVRQTIDWRLTEEKILHLKKCNTWLILFKANLKFKCCHLFCRRFMYLNNHIYVFFSNKFIYRAKAVFSQMNIFLFTSISIDDVVGFILFHKNIYIFIHNQMSRHGWYLQREHKLETDNNSRAEWLFR